MPSFINPFPIGNGGGGGSNQSGSETVEGIVKFATHGESAPLKAVQANDPRVNSIILSNTPPSNKDLIWVDNSSNPWSIKYYNQSTLEWEKISSSGSIDDLKASDIEYINQNYPNLNDVQKALDKLLYVNPQITNFTNNIGTVEKGRTITNVNLTWSLNKQVNSLSISGIGNINSSATSYNITNTSITSDKSYTLTANDGTNSVSATTSIVFRQKIYYGTNSNTVLTNSDILNLNSQFAISRVLNKNIDGNGEYIYFAYPSSFGAATFKINGLISTAWEQSTINFTNASGFTENYIIYRSTSIQYGTGISIEIQ